jgi:hypothetical protein
MPSITDIPPTEVHIMKNDADEDGVRKAQVEGNGAYQPLCTLR